MQTTITFEQAVGREMDEDNPCFAGDFNALVVSVSEGKRFFLRAQRDAWARALRHEHRQLVARAAWLEQAKPVVENLLKVRRARRTSGKPRSFAELLGLDVDAERQSLEAQLMNPFRT